MTTKEKAKALLIKELRYNQRVKLLSSLRNVSVNELIESIEDRFTYGLAGRKLKCQVAYRDLDHDIFILDWIYTEYNLYY